MNERLERVGREMQDGLPIGAQLIFVLAAIVAGTFLAEFFHTGGMEVGLAAPLGFFIGITAVAFSTFGLWVAYLWIGVGQND